MAGVQSVSDWRGKDLIDQAGEKIGKLQDVYVDTDTDVPTFGTIKEGHVSKHLTFVPLTGALGDPDGLKVTVSKDDVKHAPNIEQDGELDADAEATLYRHYEMSYTPAAGASGRRLARR